MSLGGAAIHHSAVILHNNAAASSTNAVDLDVVTLDMAVFDRLVAVNLKGVVMGCKHAIPHMLDRGGGSIVNTASIEAFRARGVRAVYGATKAAIVQFTKSVAVQYGPRGIRCNAVAPGPHPHARSRGHHTRADRGIAPDLPDAQTLSAGRCGARGAVPRVSRCWLCERDDTDG
jgi:NAD(P)-dependent dehydrogenase (short-subunit alcohol dehydrogenase family)